MTQKDWNTIRYFKMNENWGDPFQMEKELMVKLEKLRGYIKKPIVIHCGYSVDGHSSQSYHYKGMAVDMHIVGLSLLDQYLVAELFDFWGIGVYPFWNNQGLHLDIRTDKITRWVRNDKNVYTSLNSAAFKI